MCININENTVLKLKTAFISRTNEKLQNLIKIK